MSSINDAGYLSVEIDEWIEKHRKKALLWFELCESINKFSHSIMLSIEVHSKYLPELIPASLYVRSMSSFQGVIIMAERGMINEAKSLLRCLLECMFTIVAIHKDKNIAKKLVLGDLLQRKNYLKAYKRTKEGQITHESNPSLEDIKRLEQDIENSIQKEKAIKLTVRDLAEKAGLATMYDTAYKLLSSTIHVDVRDLEQYLDLNKSNEIKNILWEPDIREIDFVLYAAAESMLYVLESISRIFTLQFDESWKKILNNFEKLKKEFEATI
jgi:hypothetical protein